MKVPDLFPPGQFNKLTPELFQNALKLIKSGTPVLHAAEELNVSRSTLRDRLEAHEKCSLPNVIKDALTSSEGEDFIKRFAIVLHVELRNSCACGLRVIENILRLTGLSSFIGASLGSQWNFGCRIDDEIITFGNVQCEKMKSAIKDREISLACDENFHEGPCLVAMEPVSNFIVLEELCESRSAESWKNAMEPVLATLGVRVTQVVSDSGTSILALAEHFLEASHSPDLFHVLYDFRRTFNPALRTVKREIEASILKCERDIAELERMEEHWKSSTPRQRAPGRPPDFENRRTALEDLFNEHISSMCHYHHCEQTVNNSLKKLSSSYHPVCQSTGKRTGEMTFSAVLEEVISQLNWVVRELALSMQAKQALEKFERMTDRMTASVRESEKRWKEIANGFSTDKKLCFALEAWLAPAAYLERISQNSTEMRAHDLKNLAGNLRRKACESVGEKACLEARATATRMADEFHRTSSMVEGRNGYLSLRHHALHELSSTRRKVLTIIHNYVNRRSDGTTASERLSGIKADDLIDWLCLRIKSFPKAGGKRQSGKSQMVA